MTALRAFLAVLRELPAAFAAWADDTAARYVERSGAWAKEGEWEMGAA